MPALARLLLALGTLAGGWYTLYASPAFSGGAAPSDATTVPVVVAGVPAAEATAAVPAGRGAAVVPGDGELDALLVRSRDAFAAGQWAESLEPTRQLVARFPGQHVYLARLAETYRKLGRPADEAATWETFMDRSPLPADACPFIGHAYRKLGKYDQALNAFERCYESDPRNAELAFFVGLGHEWASHFDTAEEWYERAVGIAPPHYDSEVGLARLQLHRSRLTQALRQARDVLEHVPSHVDAALVAGLAEQRAGHRAQARTYLETAAKLSADYFDVQLALGVLDYSESRYQDARGRFEIAARLDASRRDEVQPWLERTASVKVSP
jgi:tetratricopeptide (TPR) repeat protein